MNLPNIITLARILLVPVFVVIYLWPGDGTYLIAATLFALAAATDWLDGYLARRLNQTTPFGAFLDPVADKLIVVSALTVLLAQHSTVWLTLPGLIIIGREIMISALREWMAEMNSSVTVAVSYLGKIKTSLQMIAIAVLLALPPNSDSGLIFAGYTLLYVAALMTLWSMSVYLQAAWPTLRQGLATANVNKKSKEPT
ncbi:MAG TPA: CDP-diacylglycerol--glycerol-3-phosphate 3-phosphatidyltransferase [Gammaproteobacteria bacterium]|nr:CDP-diacylglycerol--glycerol-3-phosphate 3-phosphatidyltransferase [Gammaproteobacteria bacterium]HBK11232.1 CDP-diacylglycerol--glycerol-3-phosphate 3-phosphatidyltransferase [Gammaproteobacteria bacterium]